MSEMDKFLGEIYDKTKNILSEMGVQMLKLREENALLRQALEEVEWVGENHEPYEWHECPWCGWEGSCGHKPGCSRQHALGLDKKEG